MDRVVSGALAFAALALAVGGDDLAAAARGAWAVPVVAA